MPIDLNIIPLGEQVTGQIEENESNNVFELLPSYGENYGSKEARLAIAIAEASGNVVGGGGGGLTTTDITNAVNAANLTLTADSIDMSNARIDANTDDLENLLTISNTNTDGLESLILTNNTILLDIEEDTGNISTNTASLPGILLNVDNIRFNLGDNTAVAGDDTVLGQLKRLNASVAGEATSTADGFVPLSATAVFIVPANASRTEIVIQNKSDTERVYIRSGAVATLNESWTLLPLESRRISGLVAQLNVTGRSEAGETPSVFYVEVIE